MENQAKEGKIKETKDPKQKIEQKIQKIQQKLEQTGLDDLKKKKYSEKLESLKQKLVNPEFKEVKADKKKEKKDPKQKLEGEILKIQQKLEKVGLDEAKKAKYTEKLQKLKTKQGGVSSQGNADVTPGGFDVEEKKQAPGKELKEKKKDSKQKGEQKMQKIEEKLGKEGLDEAKKTKYLNKLEKLKQKLSGAGEKAEEVPKAGKKEKKDSSQKTEKKVQEIQQKLENPELDEAKKAKYTGKLQKLQTKLGNVVQDLSGFVTRSNFDIEEKRQAPTKDLKEKDVKGKIEEEIKGVQQKLQMKGLDEANKEKYLKKLEKLNQKWASADGKTKDSTKENEKNEKKEKKDKKEKKEKKEKSENKDPKQKIEAEIQKVQEKLEKANEEKKGKHEEKLGKLKEKLANAQDFEISKQAKRALDDVDIQQVHPNVVK